MLQVSIISRNASRSLYGKGYSEWALLARRWHVGMSICLLNLNVPNGHGSTPHVCMWCNDGVNGGRLYSALTTVVGDL